MENKYQIIISYMIEQFANKKYQVDQKLPTELELMKQFDVGRHTVRKALSELENDGYIYRVQGAGSFVADITKNQTTINENKKIAILTTHISDYIFPEIISGIEKVLTQNKISLILSSTQNNTELERKNLLNLLNNDISGLIIEPTKSAFNIKNEDFYQKFIDRKIPIITINAKTNNPKIPFFIMDDNGSGFMATNKLIELGHTNLLGIFKTDDQQGIDRMNGFNTAVQKSESPLSVKVITYQTNNIQNQLYEKLKDILKQRNFPTGIICYNDQIALKVCQLASKAKLSTPKDFSIISFDNSSLAKSQQTKLVSINHPKSQMGKDVASLMVKIINNPNKDYSNCSIVYPAQLSEGDSIQKY